jgi:MFS transporter, DHA1 family, multidrug resistance protein
MFDNLGIQWAATLLGCLALLMIPIPILFYIYGPKLRAKSKFAPTMKAKPPPADDSESETGDEYQDMALHASKSHANAPSVGVVAPAGPVDTNVSVGGKEKSG